MLYPTTYVDVILPLPLEGSFTFALPDDLVGKAEIGKRAIVQFGKRKIYTGLILSIHQQKPENYDIKPVLEIIDERPIVNLVQLQLWQWMADYYMCSIGEVYRAALPSGLKLESNTNILQAQELPEEYTLTPREEQIFDIVKTEKQISISRINDLMEIKNAFPHIKSLIEKNIVQVEEKLFGGFKAKTETYVRLHTDYIDETALNSILDKLTRAPKQHQLVMSYLQLSNDFNKHRAEKISRKILLKKSGTTHATLNSLIKKGVFELAEEKVSRLSDDEGELMEMKILSEKQQEALDAIKKGFAKKDITLLHGVTSSGKTEIYIHLINEYLKQGKQVLYLLPEIALTTQIINRLKDVFGKKVGIYHSRYSDAERVETWMNIMQADGEESYDLVLGARSALFLPFSKLGLIIVDEEHETSFKQHSPSPRYNARDSAIVMAHQHQAKVLLGTATPSLESYQNAQSGRYHLVELFSRYQDILLPSIEIADVKTARRKKLMKSIFSPQLLEAMSEALGNGKQIILFQNRRGFAPYLECPSCNWVPKCQQCDVSMTYHKFSNYLTCHYCGHSAAMPQKCPDCGEEKIATRGFGTEKVEDEIGIFFPDAKVQRMDLDTTRAKNSYLKIISAFEQGEVDILVGTQMVSKGLDFDNVSLVGILNADSMMNFPDFRAFERSFQMMAQVSGRAGRKNQQGKVIIQVSDPEHPIVKDVQANNYLGMYNHQIAERHMFLYPPYVRLIQLSVRHKEVEQVNKTADALGIMLKKVFGRYMLGPEFPIIKRIQGKFHKNILVKVMRTKNATQHRNYIRDCCKEILSNPYHRSVQLVIDVDPV